MRWDALFDDLEGQAAALARAERAGEIDDRTRGEVGSMGWRDRARAAVGGSLRLTLLGGFGVPGVLTRVGPDWLLLEQDGWREVLVVADAVTSVRGLGRYAAVPESAGVVESRLGLRHALRGVVRDRSPVRLHLTDASTVDATVDRVGSDFIEVAAHAAGELRRRQDVRETELLPLRALAAVRRAW